MTAVRDLERQLAAMVREHRREEKKLAAQIYRAARAVAVKQRKGR